MKLDISKNVDLEFNNAVDQITSELKKEGFGVITEIDLKEKFKEKLRVNYRNYKILGACNPEYAHKAIGVDDKIGLMLPCNILVQQHEDGHVEVSAINPLQSIGGMGDKELDKLATEVSQKLKSAVDRL